MRSGPLLWMMIAGTAAAMAQPPAAPPHPADTEIIVTAPDRTMRQAVRQATHAISKPSEGQIARFNDPVCPRVEGLPAYHAGIVEGRMRRLAETFGVPLARSGCRPNVTVMIVDNGQALLRALQQSAPAIFANVPDAQRHRILADTGPVHAINLTELRGSQGERPGPGSDLVGSSLQGSRTMLIHEASIINLSHRQDLSGSLLLIDSPALVGKSLKQIGDYVMMRTLARTDPDKGRGPIESILGLFDETAPPAELTSFDRSYLQALYHGPANQRAATQMGQMTSSINHRYMKVPVEPAPGK